MAVTCTSALFCCQMDMHCTGQEEKEPHSSAIGISAPLQALRTLTWMAKRLMAGYEKLHATLRKLLCAEFCELAISKYQMPVEICPHGLRRFFVTTQYRMPII